MGPLADGEKWRCDTADNLPWLQSLPTGYASLCVTSGPYEDARTYGIGYRLKGQAWVDWMTPRVVEMCRVTNGLVCVNMAGKVDDFRYSPVVEWLVADLTRHHGVCCGPAPYVYYRSGIPGSGGPHYHRRDWEPVYVFARPEVLPPLWSDNTAMGHPPKWAPGGEMSHRLSDGCRVNQWGKTGAKTRCGSKTRGGKVTSLPGHRPSHQVLTVAEHKKRKAPSGYKDGDVTERECYSPPVLANPGNVVQELYTAHQVRELLGEANDVIKCNVGGNHLGSKAAHKSEAPFSERLVEFFVASYAPPGSVVIDPHSGSGTTLAVAYRLNRRGHGCDVRASQAKVAAERIGNVTAELFAGGPP